MAEFECTVCHERFSIPDQALAKYPGWTPKYCRKHSPKKSAPAAGKKESAGQQAGGSPSITSSCDLTPQEVLERFSAGPSSGIFTDGSSRPNPGPGGWGAVFVKDGAVIAERRGSDPQTTNNRMELTALIEGFQLVGPDDEVTLYTDSELCVNILTKWASGWEKRGWKRKTGPIENLELVKAAYQHLQTRPKLKLEWIKAHNGWRWNEYANALATSWAFEK